MGFPQPEGRKKLRARSGGQGDACGWFSSCHGPERLEDKVMGKAGSEDVGAHSLERWGEIMQGFWTSWFRPLISMCYREPQGYL